VILPTSFVSLPFALSISNTLPYTIMADLLQERLSAASSFLLQSPPGELNDVFTDLRSIVSDDQALEQNILPALKQYNLEQYAVANLEGGAAAGGKGKKVIVTPVSELSPASEGTTGEDRHADYRQGISFSFTHMDSVSIPRIFLPILLSFAHSFSLLFHLDCLGPSTPFAFRILRPGNPLHSPIDLSTLPKTCRKPLQ